MLLLVFDTPEERDKFTVLYETYKHTVYYTLGLFDFDEYTKEDLSQDIYIILANHLNHIDLNDYKKTQNYIITITRNYSLNYLRKQSRKPETSFEELPTIQDSSEDILKQLINKDLLNRLTAEIHKLDEIYRSVLELKYINEFSNDEIAAFLKIKKKTVEMRLYRANQILKNKLKEHIDA